MVQLHLGPRFIKALPNNVHTYPDYTRKVRGAVGAKVNGSTPFRPTFILNNLIIGAIAQLGEHLPCKQEVIGSIPIGSTNLNVSRLNNFKMDSSKPESIPTWNVGKVIGPRGFPIGSTNLNLDRKKILRFKWSKRI